MSNATIFSTCGSKASATVVVEVNTPISSMRLACPSTDQVCKKRLVVTHFGHASKFAQNDGLKSACRHLLDQRYLRLLALVQFFPV